MEHFLKICYNKNISCSCPRTHLCILTIVYKHCITKINHVYLINNLTLQFEFSHKGLLNTSKNEWEYISVLFKINKWEETLVQVNLLITPEIFCVEKTAQTYNILVTCTIIIDNYIGYFHILTAVITQSLCVADKITKTCV